MRIHKFIFSYIDHTNNTCTTLIGEVHNDKVVEWVHEGNDVEQYVKWVSHEVRMTHALKRQVCSRLINLHTGGKMTPESFENGFIIEKIVHKKDGVSVNKHAPKATTFRSKHCHEFFMIEHCKGTPKPSDSYTKNMHQAIFEIRPGQTDDNIDLNQLCDFHKGTAALMSEKSMPQQPIQNPAIQTVPLTETANPMLSPSIQGMTSQPKSTSIFGGKRMR